MSTVQGWIESLDEVMCSWFDDLKAFALRWTACGALYGLLLALSLGTDVAKVLRHDDPVPVRGNAEPEELPEAEA